MKKKANFNYNIPRSVYISIIILGIIFTLISLVNDQTYTEMSRNIFSVFSNFGTGLFASGIFGWIIDSINSRNNHAIVAYKRESLLRDLKTVVQTFLNDGCNKYFEVRKDIYNIQNEVKQILVRDIFRIVKQFEKTLLAELGNGQIESKEYSEDIEMFYQKSRNFDQIRTLTRDILTKRDLYIVNGIFSEEEIELFVMINSCVIKLQELLENKEFFNAVAFIDQLYDKLFELIDTIDQFGDLLNLKFVTYTIKSSM